MAPALGPGMLLGLLGLLWDPAGATRVLHSLRYLHMAVSEPGPGLPQFMSMGYLDEILFQRYNSEQGRTEPQAPWMAARAEPGYWDSETQFDELHQHMDVADLKTLQELNNQSEGLHTMQAIFGCDLLPDGSVRGSDWHGYNGQEFFSFDLESGSFMVADGAAQIIKKRWETDEIMVEDLTNFLGHTCVEWLWKYVGYGRETLARKDAPDVHVSGKVEYGILTLSCHVYGFYPSTIAVNWMKGDEIWDQETQWGGIVPNSDGTFHTWARIEARPEEREQFRCQVEHPAMPEPGIFAWEPESGGNLALVVAVCVVAAIVLIGLGFGIWKLQSGRRERNGYNPAAGTDMGTNGLNGVQVTT